MYSKRCHTRGGFFALHAHQTQLIVRTQRVLTHSSLAHVGRPHDSRTSRNRTYRVTEKDIQTLSTFTVWSPIVSASVLFRVGISYTLVLFIELSLEAGQRKSY